MATARNMPQGKRIAAGADARERGRKGGKASGRARSVKRSMRQWAELMRDMPAPENARAEFGADLTQAGAAVAAMYRASVAGDVRAFRALAELLGELDADAQRTADAAARGAMLAQLTEAQLLAIANGAEAGRNGNAAG